LVSKSVTGFEASEKDRYKIIATDDRDAVGIAKTVK
jgi:hypothetical protein